MKAGNFEIHSAITGENYSRSLGTTISRGKSGGWKDVGI